MNGPIMVKLMFNNKQQIVLASTVGSDVLLTELVSVLNKSNEKRSEDYLAAQLTKCVLNISETYEGHTIMSNNIYSGWEISVEIDLVNNIIKLYSKQEKIPYWAGTFVKFIEDHSFQEVISDVILDLC